MNRGLTLPELLVVVAVLSISLALAIPATARLRGAAQTSAAARRFAVTLQGLRWISVSRAQGHGLWFRREVEEWVWYRVRDANGNGLKSAEIAQGIDPVLSGPHRPGDRMVGIRLGFPPLGAIPVIPPGSGTIDDLDDPVRIGNTDLLAFGPLGGSSSGTIYITDGRERLYAVVLFGPTGRIRIWRYDARREQWSR